MINDTARLIAGKTRTDELGQQYTDFSEQREIFVEVSSITQSEFAAAGQSGIRAEIKLTTWGRDYNNERLIEYGGRISRIYRTYSLPDGRIELYLAERSGTNEC